MNDKLLVKIPFEGFYYSNADQRIDDGISQFFDTDDSGEGIIPDNAWIEMDFKPIHIQYCKTYVSCYMEWLEENGLDITLEYESLESPREYNFSTDSLYCYISKQDALKAFFFAGKDNINQSFEDRCTSCSGFISFYDNEIPEKPISEWDHNELSMIFHAIEDHKLEKINEWDLLEYNYGYEDVSNAVWDQCYEAFEKTNHTVEMRG